MGLFSKTTTSVEEIKEKETVSKIIRFSYLQSLAVNSGSGSIQEFTETEGTEDKITNSNVDNNRINKISDELNKIGGNNFISDVLTSGLSAVGRLFSSLFGKKVTKDVNLDVKDSGWSFVKSWNEPQFDIIRYAIGIRELTVSQYRYEPTSEFVSVPWSSPKEIQKITLVVDQVIPSQFPPGSYIEYYVKPNLEDSEWIRINPIDLPTVYGSDNNIVPRIITFNTEKPVNSNLEYAYINTKQPVKSVRLKVKFKRPQQVNSTDDPASYTPILKSYRLLLTPRGGL